MAKGCFFLSAPSLAITSYCDADWASCPSTKLSLTGYRVLIGDSLVTGKYKKQHIVSRSSVEAEYRALVDTCYELTWITSLLTEMQF